MHLGRTVLSVLEGMRRVHQNVSCGRRSAPADPGVWLRAGAWGEVEEMRLLQSDKLLAGTSCAAQGSAGCPSCIKLLKGVNLPGMQGSEMTKGLPGLKWLASGRFLGRLPYQA